MPQKPAKSVVSQMCQAIYLFGAVLAVAGQFDLVPAGVGWMGALLSLVGWAFSMFLRWRAERRQK